MFVSETRGGDFGGQKAKKGADKRGGMEDENSWNETKTGSETSSGQIEENFVSPVPFPCSIWRQQASYRRRQRDSRNQPIEHKSKWIAGEKEAVEGDKAGR